MQWVTGSGFAARCSGFTMYFMTTSLAGYGYWSPNTHFPGCYRFRSTLHAFHQDNRVRITLPGGDVRIFDVPPKGVMVDGVASVPLGGDFGTIEILDGCLRPRDVDPAKTDSRCLGVSVGGLQATLE